MKYFTAVIVLAVLVVSVCTAGILYVDHAANSLIDQLQSCIDLAEADDLDGAKAVLKEVQNNWDHHRKILMMYIDQQIMDEVDDQLLYMEAIANHHEEEFVPATVTCIAKLQEMQQKETISLYSWF